MRRRVFPSVFIGKFACGITILFLAQFAAAQFDSSMPYAGDPRDTRWVDAPLAGPLVARPIKVACVDAIHQVAAHSPSRSPPPRRSSATTRSAFR